MVSLNLCPCTNKRLIGASRWAATQSLLIATCQFTIAGIECRYNATWKPSCDWARCNRNNIISTYSRDAKLSQLTRADFITIAKLTQ